MKKTTYVSNILMIRPNLHNKHSLDVDLAQPQLHVNKCLDKVSDPNLGCVHPMPPTRHNSRTSPNTTSDTLNDGPPTYTHSPAHSSSSSRMGAFNLFSVIMSSHKENAAWKEAERDEARAGTKLNAERLAQQRKNAGGTGRRLAPFYKVMQGMPIAVDAFRYGKIPGVKAYLLR